MVIRIKGIRALLIGLIVLAFLIAIVVIVGSIFILIIPVLVVLGIIAFIIKKIIPRKKPKPTKEKEYIEAEFKVKE